MSRPRCTSTPMVATEACIHSAGGYHSPARPTIQAFLRSPGNQSWIGSFAFEDPKRQCKNHQGGKLNPRTLQATYVAALSGTQMCGDAKRHTPIFQRGRVIDEKQAVQDAANALTALWKIGEPIKR
jgi:hypothetical protein